MNWTLDLIKMTDNEKELKQIIFEQNILNSQILMDAKVQWVACSDKHKQWKQVIITYNEEPLNA